MLKTSLHPGISAKVRLVLGANLLCQFLIVVTGGLVRLSKSGLGCPQWPNCSETSLTNTPEMGWHGYIEFGNRTLTGLLLVVSLAAVIVTRKLRRRYPSIFWLSFAVLMGIPSQAIIGGISVWSKLNPYVVGLHFVLSMVLIVLTTWALSASKGERQTSSRLFRLVTSVMLAAIGAAVLLGVLTTGSGPHAGDPKAPRNGLDMLVLTAVHSVAGYICFALLLFLLVLSARHKGIKNSLYYLLAVLVLQIAVGVLQARTGLPEYLVIVHLALAGLIVNAAALVAYRVFQGRTASMPTARKSIDR